MTGIFKFVAKTQLVSYLKFLKTVFIALARGSAAGARFSNPGDFKI